MMLRIQAQHDIKRFFGMITGMGKFEKWTSGQKNIIYGKRPELKEEQKRRKNETENRWKKGT